jgi:hypothetical protein
MTATVRQIQALQADAAGGWAGGKDAATARRTDVVELSESSNARYRNGMVGL